MEQDPRAQVRPTREQVDWQEAELSMFLHFGVNTFTDREWGEGTEDPRVFAPTELDAAQWVSVAKETGFRYVILTAKHHDGFCLWPSKFTDHSVKASPWRNGRGDVVREFSRAVHAAKLKLGIYVSPWDRHERSYGDSPAYNRHFVNQLTELLTEYGEVAEVWFDGACGEGPNGKRQEYDWQAYYDTIRKLQPKALIAICGPDIRWVGNEDGYARETEWSIQKAPAGARNVVEGWSWHPAECDVSIRPGWFWHAAEDTRVKSLEHLTDIYYKSVGRNSVLLLNVPPNTRGLLPDPDVARLREWRQHLDATFRTDLLQGKKARADAFAKGMEPSRAVDGRPNTHWSPGPERLHGTLEVDLQRPASVGTLMMQEQIAEGQRVEAYEVEGRVAGEWRPISKGTTIGHKKLDRIERAVVDAVRLRITAALAPPLIRRFGAF
ncbi:MAG: alpha-L-fucosidase [Chthonomonadales bacterium]|nr:alpha-L-fucosidase [Chthonomonadales bacterium]